MQRLEALALGAVLDPARHAEWSTPGMNTQKRPGSDTCWVTRGPLVPIDSLVTWTRTSWPFFR